MTSPGRGSNLIMAANTSIHFHLTSAFHHVYYSFMLYFNHSLMTVTNPSIV